MKRRTFLTVAAGACSALASATAGAAADPQDILAASDAVRNPSRPFSVVVTLIEYRNSQQTDSNTLAVYSKSDSASGRFRSLIRFIAPGRSCRSPSGEDSLRYGVPTRPIAWIRNWYEWNVMKLANC